MYKVLVAESDSSAIKLITSLVEEKIQNAKVVAVAHSGNDVVVDTINNEPDLIIMAIKIAGMNGIETIKKIRRFNKGVHIIIVSAYDYFEFAREAMILGVNDYILKPINKQELQRAIERELQAVEEENERERQYRNEEKQFNSAMKFVEQHMIYSISYNIRMEVEQYSKLIPIGSYGYIMGITIAPLVVSQNWDMEKATGRIYRRIKDIISQQTVCVVGPRILNRFVVYIPSEREKDGKEEQLAAMQLAKEVVHGLKDTFDIEAKVAIGGIKPVENIHDSYVEMLRVTTCEIDTPIVYYKEVRHKGSIKDNTSELTEQLVEYIRYDKLAAEEVFVRILELLRPLDGYERLSYLIEVFSCITYVFRNELKSHDLNYDFLKQCERLIHIPVEEQELWAHQRFNNILRMMKSGKAGRKSNVVNVAMEYIQKHYNEDISLNEISQYVNLSPQYFSKIFKETTNFTYIEWVNNIRITKAKEYMNQGEYTIKEICYLVGFQDPNYFSRIFKKFVGISPTDYARERAVL